jgi:hypothetical protein
MSTIDRSLVGRYLYNQWGYWPDDNREPWRDVIEAWPITKVTAKRVYFTRRFNGRDVGNGFADRFALERDRTVKVTDRHGHRVTLTLDEPAPHNPDRPKRSLAELKREMADAHPDRGGDREQFQVARQRYLRAKAVSA